MIKKIMFLTVGLFALLLFSGCVNNSYQEECEANCEYLGLGFFELEREGIMSTYNCLCYHKEAKDIIEIWESGTMNAIREQQGIRVKRVRTS